MDVLVLKVFDLVYNFCRQVIYVIKLMCLRDKMMFLQMNEFGIKLFGCYVYSWVVNYKSLFKLIYYFYFCEMNIVLIVNQFLLQFFWFL